MRSTMNTFVPQSNLKSKLKDSNHDAQSNMFSNGFGTSTKWNNLAENEERKRNGRGKMTSTQMKFNRGYDDGRSGSGESRGGFTNKLKKKTAATIKGGKSGPIDFTNGANRRNSGGSQDDKEYDENYMSRNHSESDEAVDDRGAAF
jgi:hypothetical protein